MNILFFQNSDTTNQLINAASNGIKEPQVLWDFLLQSGWSIYVLFAFLIIALFVFFERMIYLNAAGKLDKSFLPKLEELLLANEMNEADSLAKNNHSSSGKIIAKGVQRIGRPMDELERSMQNVYVQEMFFINKKTALLSLLARLSIFVGAIVSLFQLMRYLFELNNAATFDLVKIWASMYVFFIPVFVGFCIALLIIILRFILSGKIRKTAHKLCNTMGNFIDILQKPSV